ncbi:DNA-binding protein [Cryobacterium cheniae]|uniref:DNA-binding protein n=1 Tax=Cryobacterium cheniae TaxID=1259262 RepID=A0A4R8XQZ8_9MICO|nr:helix-turn-helix domain-containing protein [Cryobacterium cheniae]TFC81163.1 DNA-binding protein [Cryobacterium cheniae]
MTFPQTPDRPRLLRPDDAARYLSRSAAALAQLRYRGTGPKYVKTGRLVRYRLADLEAWATAGERTTT